MKMSGACGSQQLLARFDVERAEVWWIPVVLCGEQEATSLCPKAQGEMEHVSTCTGCHFMCTDLHLGRGSAGSLHAKLNNDDFRSPTAWKAEN